MKKNEEKVVTPSELYGHIGEILGMIRWGGKSFTIQKHGRSMAKLISAGEIRPSSDGKRRFPRSGSQYKQVTPGQFRSRMSDLLARVRFGNQRVLITYRGKVVAIVAPVSTPRDRD